MNIREKVYRLWRREGFKKPEKDTGRAHPGSKAATRFVRRRAERPDHVWTWDFIHDRTTNGQPLKWFAITDEYTRECLALEVDRGLTADGVLDILTNLLPITRGILGAFAATTGRSSSPRRSVIMANKRAWRCCTWSRGVPGRTGFAESFLSRLRDELLNCEEFANSADRRSYRPTTPHKHDFMSVQHSGLDSPTPMPSRHRVGCFRYGSRFHSSSTREEKKTKKPCYLLPNPSLITTGTEIGGIPTRNYTMPSIHHLAECATKPSKSQAKSS